MNTKIKPIPTNLNIIHYQQKTIQNLKINIAINRVLIGLILITLITVHCIIPTVQNIKNSLNPTASPEINQQIAIEEDLLNLPVVPVENITK